MRKDEEQLEDIKPLELAGILASIPALIFMFVSLGRALGIPELM